MTERLSVCLQVISHAIALRLGSSWNIQLHALYNICKALRGSSGCQKQRPWPLSQSLVSMLSHKPIMTCFSNKEVQTSKKTPIERSLKIGKWGGTGMPFQHLGGGCGAIGSSELLLTTYVVSLRPVLDAWGTVSKIGTRETYIFLVLLDTIELCLIPCLTSLLLYRYQTLHPWEALENTAYERVLKCS